MSVNRVAAVAHELSQKARETRRLSDGHVDGVAVAKRRADAIDVTSEGHQMSDARACSMA